MRIEIKSAQEWSTFEKARQDCVVTSSLYAYLTGIKWASPDWAVMVWEDEEMVSNVHIIRREIKVGETTVLAGGIGNVATKVEWRKRGYAREALDVATRFIREELKADFGVMIALDSVIPIYERRGWKVVAKSMRVDQLDGKTELKYPVMVLPVRQNEWPEGEIDLCGLPW